jgi:hypothetical protein
VRKAFGIAALLALLAIPLTGSANATSTYPPKTTVCAKVLISAHVDANTDVRLFGAHMYDKKYDDNDPLLRTTAEVDGKVFAVVCVVVDATVALKLDADGLVKVGIGPNGGVLITARASLQTLLLSGKVSVFAKVCARAHGDLDAEADISKLDVNAYATADAKVGCINLDAHAFLKAFTKVDAKVLAKFEVVTLPKKHYY